VVPFDPALYGGEDLTHPFASSTFGRAPMRIFGTHDPATVAQLAKVADHARRVALMAEGHVGYVMPIGGVAAYHDAVSVVGVGFDIACGNAAIRTDQLLNDLGRDEREVHHTLSVLADEIADTVSFGLGRKNHAGDTPIEHPLFRDAAWDATAGHRGKRKSLRRRLCRRDRKPLGWSPLRQPRVRSYGRFQFPRSRAGQELGGERVPETEVLLSLNQPLGHDYWHLMNLAGRYAYAGREWVAREVLRILGGPELELVHNHHNFAWKETLRARSWWWSGRVRPLRFPGKRASSADPWGTMP
jgi:tRNA-splicing ligase RtcB